jgi:TatD DNase family protein
MIDSHCHLEQSDYSKDLDEVIEKCKKSGLKAVITSCAHPKDFDWTMKIAERFKGFVFCTIGIHPEYIKEISDKEIEKMIESIKKNKDKIVGIGEIGLDYHWVKEEEWKEKQRELFIKMIRLAKELDKPIVIHSREALEDTLSILEGESAEHVLLHMWSGQNLMDKVNELGYYVSMNSIVMSSKSYRKVIKKIPQERLLLETDAPWLAVKKTEDGYAIDPKARNDPTTIRLTCDKIADLKDIDANILWKVCGRNAVRFFGLPFDV